MQAETTVYPTRASYHRANISKQYGVLAHALSQRRNAEARMREQLQKLQGHTSNLLNSFVQLRDRYALLHPMLVDERISAHYRGSRQERGYAVLLSTLFLDCCHDLANICFDHHEKTASIRNLTLALNDINLRRYICKQHSSVRLMTEICNAEDWVAAMYKKSAATDAMTYAALFEKRFDEFNVMWAAFQNSPTHQNIKTIRDQITAHTELRRVNGEYRAVDITEQSFEWEHLKPTIETIQTFVTKLSGLIRDADIAWESFERVINSTAHFWDEKGTLDAK
jgi:hypothetical protein